MQLIQIAGKLNHILVLPNNLQLIKIRTYLNLFSKNSTEVTPNLASSNKLNGSTIGWLRSGTLPGHRFAAQFQAWAVPPALRSLSTWCAGLWSCRRSTGGPERPFSRSTEGWSAETWRVVTSWFSRSNSTVFYWRKLVRQLSYQPTLFWNIMQ